MTGSLADGYGAHDDAHAFWDLELLHDAAKALTFFWLINLTRDAELL